MIYSVKCIYEINEVIEQIRMGIKMLFYKGSDICNMFDRIREYTQYTDYGVLLPFQNLTCSLDIIYSTCDVSMLVLYVKIACVAQWLRRQTYKQWTWVRASSVPLINFIKWVLKYYLKVILYNNCV